MKDKKYSTTQLSIFYQQTKLLDWSKTNELTSSRRVQLEKLRAAVTLNLVGFTCSKSNC